MATLKVWAEGRSVRNRVKNRKTDRRQKRKKNLTVLVYYNIQQPAIHSDRPLVEYWLYLNWCDLGCFRIQLQLQYLKLQTRKIKEEKKRRRTNVSILTVPYNTLCMKGTNRDWSSNFVWKNLVLRLKKLMCISPPPIQFSPINYSTTEGNFLLQPLQTMKRTSLKEVLLFEVVIEAAKAAAASNRGPWSVWISKRAAPQNNNIIISLHMTLRGPYFKCLYYLLVN